MKKTILLLLLTPLMGVVAFPGKKFSHIDTYRVDIKTSKVEWVGENVTGSKHEGTINLTSGILLNDHGRFTGTFVMDMNSIACTDLTGSYKAKLETHLKNEDFFYSASFPTATLEVISITPRSGISNGQPNFNIIGKLTIKGITKEITFPALLRFEGAALTATGDMRVDRAQYDIRYGSKSFFNDLGDKAINDEFVLKFDIRASR